MRQSEHFVEVGADNNDRHAFAGEFGDDFVDGRASADIDAARRLVENDDLGLAQDALGDDHFLLVAARQRSDRLVGLALDEEACNAALGERPCPRAGDPAGRRDAQIVAER